MTIRLLAAYGIYPVNAIVTIDSGTEAGLIGAKMASANLTGGVAYVPPVLPNQFRTASLVLDGAGNVLGLAGPNNTIITLGGGTSITKPTTPAAPTLTAMANAISVAYTIPADGGNAITSAEFLGSDGVTTALTGSPQTIAKTAGTSITGRVRFRNSIDWSDFSPASNSVQPSGGTSAPSVLTNPVITGTPTEGQAATATAGTFSGSPTPSVVRDWKIDGVSKGATYTYATGDANKTAVVTETASNGVGSPAVSTSAGVTIAAAVAVPISIPSSAFTVLSGTPGTGSDANGSFRSLAAGATADIQFDPGTAMIMDQAYEVFLNWSAPTLSAGTTITARTEYMPDTTVNTGVTKYFFLGKLPTANALDRSQLPLTFCRTSANPLPKLRFGRQSGDSAPGAMQLYSVDLVPVAAPVDATVTVIGAKINNTVTLTPNNGNAVTRGLGLNTPICTSDDALYIQCPSTAGGGQTTRLAKINKATGAEILTVTVNTVSGGHDITIGHRDSSCFVTAAGTLITHPEGHMQPWQGKYALNGDIANLVDIAVPTGLDVACAYRRFYQNPFDGSVWMAVRGFQYASGIYKWNEASKTFTRTSATFLAGDYGSNVGSYGMEIAFASASKVYITEEWFRGTVFNQLSGYPRQNTTTIVSTDSGATWKRMAGDKTLPMPMSVGSDDGNIAFPNLNNSHNSVGGNVGVAGDGNPVVVSPWTHPAETLRSLWIAKWNPTTKLWDRRRLLANDGANHIGNPKIAYTSTGTMYITCASSDDHSVAGGDRVPENNQVYVFVCNEPTGLVWRRYAINHAAAGYAGTYIDSEGIRKDNILRLLPIVRTDDLRDEVWTLALPA